MQKIKEKNYHLKKTLWTRFCKGVKIVAINNSPDRKVPILDLIREMEEAKRHAEFQHRDGDKLSQQWESAKAVGRIILERRMFKHIETHLTKEEMFMLWEKFMAVGEKTLREIVSELKINPPDEILVDYLGEPPSENTIIGVDIDEEGKTTLYLYPLQCLSRRFLHFVLAKYEFQKRVALREFGKDLAHESYHLYQFQQYRHAFEREHDNQPYAKRKYEKGARIFAIQWLRKQKPENIQDRIAIGLVAMDQILQHKQYEKESKKT